MNDVPADEYGPDNAAQRFTKVDKRKGIIVPAGAAWTFERSACQHGLEQAPAMVNPARGPAIILRSLDVLRPDTKHLSSQHLLGLQCHDARV